MILSKLSRRSAVAKAGILLGGAIVAPHLTAAPLPQRHETAGGAPKNGIKPFRFSLNTATIRGQKLGIVKEIEVISAAGYDGFEPWVGSIEEYVNTGGSLTDLKNRIRDAGLKVEGAIGFPEWIVDDDGRRAKGLERARREMEWVSAVGGTRMAAPAAGATNLPKLDPFKMAERYRTLLDLGDEMGVTPLLELWGFSKNLNRLGECVWVAMEARHPKAAVLADIFHMHKGGSDFSGLRMVHGDILPVFHMNDYPAEPTPDKMDDSFRVFPGDGVAPTVDILKTLAATGQQKVLSLELFNRKYYEQDPFTVAKQGLEKMKAAAAHVGA